jgi:hypothetical protein
MPSVLGGGFTKAMGPLMTAIGTGLMFVPGGQAFGAPMAMGGLQSMMGQGGVLGPSTPKMPSLTAPAPAMSAAPMSSPEMPSPAGAGLTPTVPGPGAASSQGAGTAGTLGTDIASNLLSSQNPFAQYATAA